MLAPALERAGAGQGQVVAIVGEPGLGKSRLVHEFVRSEPARDWLVHETGAVPHGGNTAYLPVSNLLRSVLAVEAGDSPADIAQKLRDSVTGLDAGLMSILPALHALLDLPIEDQAWHGLDPRQRRRRIIDGIRTLILRRAASVPLMMVFEDLHWIDTETQAVLDNLVDGLGAARLLLLVTYRPEYTHDWAGKSYYARVSLDPLPDRSAEAFLGSLIGDDPALDGLKRHLIERTEGTPLFLEETVRTLVETGALAGERKSYRLVKDIAEIEVPPTVQAVLASRIDRLPPAPKDLLQIAAVIGRKVPFTLLQGLAGLPEEALHAGLTELHGAEFLYQTRTLPHLEYTFKPALTEDVAYESLLRDRRRTLHARVVEVIEATHPDRLDEHVEELSRHALKAGSWDQAHRYARQAATKAHAKFAYNDAIAFFEQALSALDNMPETDARIPDKIDIRLEMRSALWPLGKHDQLVARIREAEGLAKSVGDTGKLATVHIYLTTHYWQCGQHDEAIKHGIEGMKLAREVGEFSIRVSARQHSGLVYCALGDYRRSTEMHREVAKELTGPPAFEHHGMAGFPAMISRGFLAWGLSEMGDFEEARTWSEEGAAMAEQVNSTMTTVWVNDYLALGYLHQGRLDPAVEVMERNFELCREAEVWLLFTLSAGILGYARVLSGRPELAVPLLEEAIEPRFLENFPEGSGYPFVWLGEAYLANGQPDKAAAAGERALEIARKHGERGHEAWALRLMARIAAEQQPEAATELFRQAAQTAEALVMRPLLAHCRLGLGNLLARTGHSNDADAELRAAAELYRAMDMAFWLPQAEAST